MWRRLLQSEIPRFRVPLVTLAGYSLIILYMTAFAAMPEAWELSIARAFIRDGVVPDGVSGAQQAFRALFWPTLLAAASFRLFVIVSGPLRFRRTLGRSYASDAMGAIVLANMVGVFALPLLIANGAAVAPAHRWIDAHVPTLVVIPAPFALLAANVVGGFAYYWWHRIQHQWRPLWLLTHRIHHLPPQLTIITTTPTEDPLGGIFSFVPRALLIGGATKLFSAAPMIPEAFLWSVVSWTAFEVVNHDEPSYRWTLGGPLRRFWFALLGGGAWHIMHHSARPGHEAVNLSGFPFQIWDRMFGTFAAPEPDPPPIGLTNRPHLWRNPLRIAFAGWAQLAGELWRNPGIATRARILLGPSRYRPPHPVYVLTKADSPERA
jgi:sterol desaturase/sphingolipid hydroxylase (fatty acid hydroxylase superfamily)